MQFLHESAIGKDQQMESDENGSDILHRIFSFVKELDTQVEEMRDIRWRITLGNFFGHLVPGTLVILFFFDWLPVFVNQYVISRTTGNQFVSLLWSSTPMLKRWRWTIPYNGLLTCFAVLAIVIFAVSFDDQGRFAYYDNSQHVAIFSSFMVHFVVVKLQSRGVSLPPSADFLSLALAYCIKAVIFVNHLSGQNKASPLKIQVHVLLAIICVAQSAVTIAEVFSRHRFHVAMLRCYLSLLEGIWAFHIGLTLFPVVSWQPIWDQHSRKSNINCTSMFAGYCLLDFVFLLILFHFLYTRISRRHKLKPPSEPGQMESKTPLLSAHVM